MKALVCELCGSNSFTKSDELFACDYCHTKYTPEQAKKLIAGGVVQVDRSNELANLLDLANSASLDHNWQEAYEYATKALEVDPRSSWAWSIKGKAVGSLSTLSNMRLNEVIGAFERSIELCAPDENDEQDLRRAILASQAAQRNLNGAILAGIAQSLYFSSREHLNAYWDLSGTVEDHGNRCETIVSALEIAHDWERNGETEGAEQTLSLIVKIVDDLAKKQTTDGFLMSTSPAPFTSTRLASARDNAVEELSQLDPNYTDPLTTREAGAQKSAGCFVATATMGGEHTLPVVTLREFRDAVLVTSRPGRAFIDWY